jgi:hypothetical protein
MVKLNLITPKWNTITDGEFTLPEGFLIGNVSNIGEAGNVIIRNADGEEETIPPDGFYDFSFIGRGRTAVTVIAMGATAKIAYEI